MAESDDKFSRTKSRVCGCNIKPRHADSALARRGAARSPARLQKWAEIGRRAVSWEFFSLFFFFSLPSQLPILWGISIVEGDEGATVLDHFPPGQM